jgi:hypothetical protein
VFGNDFGHYLRRRFPWDKLRQEYKAMGEKLVPYSCRHGYAHRAHVICDLPPKVVNDAFPKAEQLLGQFLRDHNSAQ